MIGCRPARTFEPSACSRVEALLRRVPRPALTEPDRLALRAAGTILADGGDLHRAATTFEHAGDWSSAAEVWGRLGELDAMESCLSRDEDKRRSDRAAIGAVRDIEALLAAGRAGGGSSPGRKHSRRRR